MRLIYMTFMVAILLMGTLVNGQNTIEAQANQAIAQAEKDMKEMLDHGFGIAFVNDTLLEAKKALNATNYSLVIEKTQLISERKLQAYNISDSLRALQIGVEELEKIGLNASKVKGLLNKSTVTFQEERYEEVEELIKETYAELTDIRAEATIVQVRVKAARENVISFVRDNWSSILIGGGGVFAIVYVVFNRIMVMRTRNEINDLEIEKEVLAKLMKKAQSDHFQKRTLTRESYEIKMNKYKERMIEIKELLPVLRSKVKK